MSPYSLLLFEFYLLYLSVTQYNFNVSPYTLTLVIRFVSTIFSYFNKKSYASYAVFISTSFHAKIGSSS